MTTAAELKAAHLEQIKNYLREYLSKSHEVTFIEPKEDHYAAYMLIEQGLYTGGDYGKFESFDGTVLKTLLVNENYKLKSPIEQMSYKYFYQADDFYKHLQYELAVKLFSSIKD